MGKFLQEISLDRTEGTRDKQPAILPDIEADHIIENFRTNIDSIKSKFDMVTRLEQEGLTQESKDILRSQVVFLLSTMDFYMHEIVKYGILKIFKRERTRTKSYKEFIVSLETVEKAIASPESVDWLDAEIVHRNHHKTFLEPEKIKGQLSLISTKNIFNIAATEISDNSTLANDLKDLYKRRNAIAHQTDRDNSSGVLNNIDSKDVNKYITLVSNFIEIVHREIMNET